MTSLSHLKYFLLETVQNEGWSTGVVHEGVHRLGPQWWSMVLGSMFCIRPSWLSVRPLWCINVLTKKWSQNTVPV